MLGLRIFEELLEVDFLVTCQSDYFLDKNKVYVFVEHHVLMNASKCFFVSSLFPHSSQDSSISSKFTSIGSQFKFILIVAASSVGEEPFYRVAVEGALADVLVRGNDLVVNAHGMAALVQLQTTLTLILFSISDKIGETGSPTRTGRGWTGLSLKEGQSLKPESSLSALTGLLYYMAASPKDPTYVCGTSFEFAFLTSRSEKSFRRGCGLISDHEALDYEMDGSKLEERLAQLMETTCVGVGVSWIVTLYCTVTDDLLTEFILREFRQNLLTELRQIVFVAVSDRIPADTNYRPWIMRQTLSITNPSETTYTDRFPTEMCVAKDLICSSVSQLGKYMGGLIFLLEFRNKEEDLDLNLANSKSAENIVKIGTRSKVDDVCVDSIPIKINETYGITLESGMAEKVVTPGHFLEKSESTETDRRNISHFPAQAYKAEILKFESRSRIPCTQMDEPAIHATLFVS
ncbi:hypothetical protein Tco_0639106 [Tanacetum coccineum]